MDNFLQLLQAWHKPAPQYGEPWTLVCEHGNVELLSDEGDVVVDMTGSTLPESKDLAYGSRIQLAVNLLAHLRDEHIKQLTHDTGVMLPLSFLEAMHLCLKQTCETFSTLTSFDARSGQQHVCIFCFARAETIEAIPHADSCRITPLIATVIFLRTYLPERCWTPNVPDTVTLSAKEAE